MYILWSSSYCALHDCVTEVDFLGSMNVAEILQSPGHTVGECGCDSHLTVTSPTCVHVASVLGPFTVCAECFPRVP